MEYLFRMCGRIVEVCRYQVTYTEQRVDSGGEPVGVTVNQRFPTQDEAQTIAEMMGSEVAALDTSAFDWMDGMEVADVPDTYAEAVRIYEMGQEAYLAEINAPSETDYLVELDYRLSKIELGV